MHWALQGNTALRTLGLGGNQIGSEGSKASVQVLPENTVMQKLVLSPDSIGCEGAKAFAQAFQDQQGKARMLRCLGDLEVPLENVDAAHQHDKQASLAPLPDFTTFPIRY